MNFAVNTYKPSLLPLRRAYGRFAHHARKITIHLSHPLYQVIDTKTKLVDRKITKISSRAAKIIKANPKTRILILCAGDGLRWDGIQPKQLLRIKRQTLIKRTLGQLNNRAVVVTHHPRLASCPYVSPSHRRWTCESLLSTKSIWAQETLVLLGDVYYDDHDLEKILNHKTNLCFYGSKDQGEIFALKFKHSKQNELIKNLNVAIHNAILGGRGKLWECYKSLNNISLFDPFSKKDIKKMFVNLDKCTDFDYLDEYKAFLIDYKAHKNRA